MNPSDFEIPIERPVTVDEWPILVAHVLLHPRFNPQHDWLSTGEFTVKAVGNDGDRLTRFNQLNDGGSAIERRVQEICWRWVLVGFLVPVGENRFSLTEVGRTVLTERWNEFSVLMNRGGLRDAVQVSGKALPEAVRGYADQAQLCFEAGLYQAAVIMVGIAAESAVIKLFDVLVAVAPKLTVRKAPRVATASERIQWIRECLVERRSEIRDYLVGVGASYRWNDDLPGLLTGALDVVRMTRNEAGHPSIVSIDRATAALILAVFPALVRTLDATVRAFESSQSKSA